MIHLDTGFLLHALVPDSAADHKLRGWLSSGVPLGISTIAWAEFLCGPVEAREIELATRVVPERVPFEEEDAVASARLFNFGGRRRGSMTDCMITATTMRCRASLATANLDDFRRLESAGLAIIPEHP